MKKPQQPVTDKEQGEAKTDASLGDNEDEQFEFDSDASSIDDDEFDRIICEFRRIFLETYKM